MSNPAIINTTGGAITRPSKKCLKSPISANTAAPAIKIPNPDI